MASSGASLWPIVGLLALAPGLLFLRTKRKPDEADIEEEEDAAPNDTIKVYFGSQTGTAESFAQIIAAEGRRHGFHIDVVDLEEFSASELLETGKAIFLMATYGDGEPTDNASDFTTWLKNESGELERDYLATVEFTVFGLGNTQYEHYNMVGKSTNEGMEKLGAQRMFEYGEGDDDNQLEEDFEAWREKMWMALVVRFGGKGGVDGVDKAVDLPFSVKMLTAAEAACHSGVSETAAASSSKFYWHGCDAPVVVNRELRAQAPGVGSTRHVEIDLQGTSVGYHTADNLAVLPLNDATTAEKLCAQLGYDPDSFFTLEHGDNHKPVFPTPCTVRDAFLRFMDIMAIPRRSLLEQLTPYVEDDAEREVMHLLSSKEGKEIYHREVEEPGWTLADLILERFSSLSMTLDHFLHVVPHLHPRYYTISSSSSVSPSRVHITVAVLEQDRSQGRLYRGICSSFLSSLEPHGGATAEGATVDGSGSKCRVFVRESTFRLPADSSIPIIMIGPGTGVAPMRALLQERAWQKEQGLSVGRNVLYFGCRCKDQDYIYRDELEAYQADGTLDSLRLAFSREGSSKVYVQHLLREDAAEMWGLLEGGAYVYVCGGTKMGTDVQNEFNHIAQSCGLMGVEESKEYMKGLHDAGRFVQELWS
ncbi:unnamed protein product [Ectocarpus sp. CCAP 1310/34]|nr:unnamed protein product [Ectocarpus sp. CCAP 1310/34]